MSHPGRAAGRSGDPRKRAAPAQPVDRRAMRRRVLGALVAAAAIVGVALVALPGQSSEPDGPGRANARTACQLAAQANEAASVDTNARYAASLFLLDTAITESGRAAEADSAFVDLDTAVQAVHTAAHQGRSGPWRDALDAALATCERLLPGAVSRGGVS